MKIKIIVLAISLFFLGGISSSFAQNEGHDMNGQKMIMKSSSQTAKPAAGKTDSVKVLGQCGMCKTRIEKAARSVSGVKTATWSDETKMLHLTFTGENKTAEVQKAVAKVGHDSPPYIATKAAYDALPGCCKYRD